MTVDEIDIGRFDYDHLALYLQSIGEVSLLTAVEERELAARIEAGRMAKDRLLGSVPGANAVSGANAVLGANAVPGTDAMLGAETPGEIRQLEQIVLDGEVARVHFIEANTRLVVSIAKHYRNYGLPFQDLIQAGNIGLIHAVDKFDASKGNRFSTYATWWIRQAIMRSLTEQGHTIRLPGYLRKRMTQVREAAERLESEWGRTPTIEEIAEALGMDNVSELHRLVEISRGTTSLNTQVGDDSDTELLNLIADEDAPTPAESVQSHMMHEDLAAVMQDVLTPREVMVLSQRFGLEGERSHTLQEVAEELNVSRERARQVERKALRKLRHPYNGKKLRGYLG